MFQQTFKNSFLNFKLLAPNATVDIGDSTTLRGQVVAKKVKIGKGTVISREEVFEKESDPAKVVEDQGLKFIVNEIIVLFEDTASQSDIQQVVDVVDGVITGFVSAPKIVKIEVQTSTAQELNNKIQAIKNLNSPLIIEVVQNLVAR